MPYKTELNVLDECLIMGTSLQSDAGKGRRGDGVKDLLSFAFEFSPCRVFTPP
jgi:hypothetical protein